MNNLKNLNDFYDKDIFLKSNTNELYGTTGRINKFIDILVIEKKIRNICIPNYNVIYKNIKSINTIFYNFKDNSNNLSTDIYQEIQNCLQSKKRFIFSLLNIINLKHSNLILIDTKKKTIERFEPYGWNSKNKKFIKIQHVIDNFFKDKLINYIGLKKYKYINPKKIYNKFGIQYVADSYCGMCLIICIMYLHMRIINENASQKQIVDHFMKKSKKDLKNKILKYTNYIQKKIL